MSVDFSDDCVIKKGLPFGKPPCFILFTQNITGLPGKVSMMAMYVKSIFHNCPAKVTANPFLPKFLLQTVKYLPACFKSY